MGGRGGRGGGLSQRFGAGRHSVRYVPRGHGSAEGRTELAPKVGPLIDRFDTFFVASSKVLEENSGKIANITEETLAVVKATRQQVERIGELIDDVNGRAKARIAQIDHAVESTVEQVEHASETVKSAVLKPVKEVNGLVAGVKAAISTYAQGGNRNSPEHATQDEEMFI